jgi:hypothetical protein
MPTLLDVNVTCYPNRGMAMILGDGMIDMNQRIDINNTSIQSIRVLITNGSVVIYDITQTGGDGNHSMFFSQDFNAALLNRMKTIRMVITITTTTGETHIATYQYTIQHAGTTSGMLLINTLMIDFPLMFGDTTQERQLGLSIIALFVTLLVVGAAAAKVTTDLSGLRFLALAVLGLFVFLGWVNLGAYALACLAGIAIYLLSRRLF